MRLITQMNDIAFALLNSKSVIKFAFINGINDFY